MPLLAMRLRLRKEKVSGFKIVLRENIKDIRIQVICSSGEHAEKVFCKVLKLEKHWYKSIKEQVRSDL